MCLAPILTTTLHILGSAVCKQGLVADKFLFASEFLDSYAAKLLHATVLTLFSRNVIMMMRTHHFCAAFQLPMRSLQRNWPRVRRFAQVFRVFAAAIRIVCRASGISCYSISLPSGCLRPTATNIERRGFLVVCFDGEGNFPRSDCWNRFFRGAIFCY